MVSFNLQSRNKTTLKVLAFLNPKVFFMLNLDFLKFHESNVSPPIKAIRGQIMIVQEPLLAPEPYVACLWWRQQLKLEGPDICFNNHWEDSKASLEI